MAKLLCVLIYMYFLYAIPFNFVSESVDKFVYHIIPLLYCIYNRKECIKFFKNIYWFWAIYMIGIAWGLCVIIYNNGEYSFIIYLLNGFSFIFRYVALFIFTQKHCGNEYAINNFFKFMVFCQCIYVIASIVMLFFPDLKSFWMAYIYIPDTINNMSAEEMLLNTTRFGLSGYSVFSATLQCSVMIWIVAYMISLNIWKSRWLFAIIILFMGNFLYGRSGIVSSLIVLLIIWGSRLSLKHLKNILFLMLISIFALHFILNYGEDNPIIASWINWLSEPLEEFINNIQHGRLSFGESGDTLTDYMYFLPDNDFTILFGDGYFNTRDGAYYMSTDAGFMRTMLFGGVVIAMFIYGSLSYLLLKFSNSINTHNKIVHIISFITLFVLMEFKGITFNIYYGLLIILIYHNKIFYKT